MLTINRNADGEKVTFSLEGRLDVASAPQLEEELRRELEHATELVFDLRGLRYISSAGLRVLLLAQKQMNKRGRMRLVHVTEAVMDTLEITGFADIFYIADSEPVSVTND
ncbi:MAG: STAS domain-containing protein [Oscillospiraceae bacterium]|nr:STAS domain-containing protein [Oscillospiraceae bacterium]